MVYVEPFSVRVDVVRIVKLLSGFWVSLVGIDGPRHGAADDAAPLWLLKLKTLPKVSERCVRAPSGVLGLRISLNLGQVLETSWTIRTGGRCPTVVPWGLSSSSRRVVPYLGPN